MLNASAPVKILFNQKHKLKYFDFVKLLHTKLATNNKRKMIFKLRKLLQVAAF